MNYLTEISISTSPHWRQTALHTHTLAHTDDLNPAVCFNCGAKHSIYRPLRPQQTTALRFFFPLFPAKFVSKWGCCQKSFYNTRWCDFIPFACRTSIPLLCSPNQNGTELPLSQVFCSAECAAEQPWAHRLPLWSFPICCDNGVFGVFNKLSYLFDSAVHIGIASSQLPLISREELRVCFLWPDVSLNWYCSVIIEWKFWFITTTALFSQRWPSFLSVMVTLRKIFQDLIW